MAGNRRTEIINYQLWFIQKINNIPLEKGLQPRYPQRWDIYVWQQFSVGESVFNRRKEHRHDTSKQNGQTDRYVNIQKIHRTSTHLDSKHHLF